MARRLSLPVSLLCMSLIAPVLSVCLEAAPALLATIPPGKLAELTLTNGDRLSGRILSREGGKLTLVSELLGTLTLPEASITSLVEKPIVGVGAIVIANAPPAAPTPQSPPSTPEHTSALYRAMKGSRGSVEFGLQSAFGRSTAHSPIKPAT